MGRNSGRPRSERIAMSDLETDGRPNLTPILDMVFQLITFFMLVANFQAASLDQNLRLPVVGSARPVESQGVESLLVLNIDKEGNLIVYGQPRPIKDYIAKEANASLIAARRTLPDIQEGQDLPTIVVVRADRNTPCRLFNNVIRECQARGFRKFALKCMNKEEGKG
jgi:biopolymer transport protein ExbD